MVASEHPGGAGRRLLPPRRSEIERRLGERRLQVVSLDEDRRDQTERRRATDRRQPTGRRQAEARGDKLVVLVVSSQEDAARQVRGLLEDRKSTRLNSSHSQISYAVFCLKKKKNMTQKDKRGSNTARLVVYFVIIYLCTVACVMKKVVSMGSPGMLQHGPQCIRCI